MPANSLPLLNLFEVVDDAGATHHIVAFVEPVRAGSEGIASRCVVGEFTPGPDGGFDPGSFRANPEFLAAVVDYMNDEAGRSASLVEQARAIRSDWLYVEDPRVGQDENPPAASDLLGAFAVDDVGQIVPKSFQINSHHRLFTAERGASGLLGDRRFHDWLHDPAHQS